MIGISGIPGSGKSSVCDALRKLGYGCRNVLELEGALSCLDGEEMDVECLRERLSRAGERDIIVEGHYSHLLGPSAVFILERDEEKVAETLRGRGYSDEKINENLDALRSDIIYQESLEFLPSSRIHRIRVQEGDTEATANKILQFLNPAKKD